MSRSDVALIASGPVCEWSSPTVTVLARGGMPREQPANSAGARARAAARVAAAPERRAARRVVLSAGGIQASSIRA